MVRKHKSVIELPPFIHVVRSKGKTYYYYQPHRGTAKSGKRIRIPHEPTSGEFWLFITRLQDDKQVDPDPENSIRSLIKTYQGHHNYKRLSASTQRDYDRYLQILEQRLGKFPASAVTSQVLVTLQDSMADKPSTANHAMSVYRTLFKFGVPRGFCSANPAEYVEDLKHHTENAKPWPDWAIEMAMNNARWELRTFVAIGLYTGQRTSDILRMKLSDIKNGRIKVIQQKTGKPLWIKIHKKLQPIIDDCRARGNFILVPRHNGAELDANGFRAMFTREMAKPATAPIRENGLKPHGLRASAASRLKEIGCSNGQISSITGMSTAMVERYTKQYDQVKTADETIALWENAEKS